MRHVVLAAATAAGCVIALPAPARAEDLASGEPRTGFTIEGRLAQSIAPVGIGLSAGALLPSILGGPPPASIGYRGEGWALTLGPSIGRIGAQPSSAESFSVWYFGAALLGEVRLAQAQDRRTEGYLLLGANIAGAATTAAASNGPTATGNDGIGGIPAYGFLAGVGLRHWLTPNLGIGAELGESYLDIPIGADSVYLPGAGDVTTDLHARILSTFGDIHVALVL